MNTITEDKPRLTNDEINAYLGSQNTNDIETILEVTEGVDVVENLVCDNSLYRSETEKTTTLDNNVDTPNKV